MIPRISQMPDAATLEQPAVVTPAIPATPAAPAAVTPAEKLGVETFLRDSEKVTPDVLAAMSPKWSPPKMVTRGNPAPAAPGPEVAPPAATPAPAAATAPEVPAAAAPTPETPAPATPTATTPAVELPPGVQPVDPNSPDHPKNWKVKAANAKEALVYQLVKNGTPLQEAVAEVFGNTAAPSAPATPAEPALPPEPTVDPVALADQQITALASQVAELEAQIDEKAADDPKTALKLTRQQADLKISLANAKQQRESIAQQIQDRKVESAVENHRQLENQSLTSMYEAYPALSDKTSEQRAAFNLKVAELQKDPAFGPDFREKLPGWPLMVARMVDAEKGWSRTVTPPPAAPAPVAAPVTPAPTMNQPSNPLAPRVAAPIPVAPVRATSAELLSSSSNPGASTPALNAETFWKESADVPPAELIKLFAHAPIDPRLTRAQKTDPRRFGSP